MKLFAWTFYYAVAILAMVSGIADAEVTSDWPSLVPSDMPSMVPSVVPTKAPTLGSDYPSIVPSGWGTAEATGETQMWADEGTRRLAQRVASERQERRANHVRMR